MTGGDTIILEDKVHTLNRKSVDSWPIGMLSKRARATSPAAKVRSPPTELNLYRCAANTRNGTVIIATCLNTNLIPDNIMKTLENCVAHLTPNISTNPQQQEKRVCHNVADANVHFCY